ncbi:MAG: type IV toxin-antitoxin system AbiEi family antitoxin domain-containing protein [Nitrosotalea sp.]
MHLKLSTKPLSHEEQKIYLYLEGIGKNTFKVSEINARKLGLDRSYLYVLIGRLEKKRWITRIGKGVYLRLPAETVMRGKVYLEDPFEVALKMYKGYLAFQSALKIHGLSEYESFTIYVATKNKSETIPLLKHYEIRAIKSGRRFTGFTKFGRYVVSTKTKTFFDCFYHPQYAGGYAEVLKSLHTAESIDWKEMETYLEKFGSSSICQKIGYLISLLKETEYEHPQDFIEYLKGRIGNKTKLDFGQKGGHYNKEWMIVDNIGEKKLLSWWHNG